MKAEATTEVTLVTITLSKEEAALLRNICGYTTWNSLYAPLAERLEAALVSVIGRDNYE